MVTARTKAGDSHAAYEGRVSVHATTGPTPAGAPARYAVVPRCYCVVNDVVNNVVDPLIARRSAPVALRAPSAAAAQAEPHPQRANF